jgi:hypothetical protein
MNSRHYALTSKSLVLVLAIVGLSACGGFAPSGATVVPATPKAGLASSANLTEAVLKNAKYELPDIKTVQLVDGKLESKYGEGASQVNRGELTRMALGDLNGDGAQDGVVILSVNTGGSGVFVYMLVVVNQNGAPQQVAAELLGDRVNVQNLVVKEGQIVLNALGFAPGDPMCCPTQSVIRTYRLQGDKLQVVSEVKLTATP